MTLDIATLGWIPGGIAVVLMAYAIFLTIQVSARLDNELRSGILMFMVALIAYLLMGITIGIYSVFNITSADASWIILPIEALIGSVFFVLGAKKLYVILAKI